MSGHNKWSTIKHKKAAVDAKKGKLFTKFIREIVVAAKIGGGDINANPRLRAVVEKAKAANMPKDNIEKAIKKGTGELKGENYEDITYEGYGPSGVALMIKTLTDNKNRTASSIRSTLEKYGGNLGENGCVSWMFKRKGVVTLPMEGKKEDDIANFALENNADDYVIKSDEAYIYFNPENFQEIKENLDKNNIKYIEAEVSFVPDTYVKLENDEAIRMLKLMDALEDNDDVQEVFANFDIDDEIMEKYENSQS
jgi:YebC/PmpR family DNA-binding regulatory protein